MLTLLDFDVVKLGKPAMATEDGLVADDKDKAVESEEVVEEEDEVRSTRIPRVHYIIFQCVLRYLLMLCGRKDDRIVLVDPKFYHDIT